MEGIIVIVVLRPHATREEIESVKERLHVHGMSAMESSVMDSSMLISEGTGTSEFISVVEKLPAVERVVVVPGVQRLTSRVFRPENTHVRVGALASAVFGGPEFVVIAGPCAVENVTQMNAAVDTVVGSGAVMLRGGAFKPRTSPYSFQGLGLAGLTLLAEQRKRTGLPVVTEVVTPKDVEFVAEESDMLQIGTRNMQNFELLREAGASGRPVLLKRGMSATIEEWLLAAEYLLHVGNGDVVLCERGIRSYDRSTRFTLDLSAVAEAKRLTHLPVIVDPSHSTGQPHLVAPMSLAAAACGADGLIIDVHTDARNAMCDGAQALSGEQFADVMTRLTPVVEAVGRTMAPTRAHSLASV
ncbi:MULTISPECIES: 3-deoxy-7-phosphoheptulonate synthase [unclassified Streptomyces]|uniref:3-deoxy-7-phosphoheptulonate synthase n=1 Tax=unclassified Streptomyces TaxID=2593676 RepID=UPI00226EC719|nr:MULTISPECIES: 3-deoxy-7-phosphoheptulonate synthase [unclassified Streptomyces]MCY0917383.1 3-deoxy-7-phosphoheptulonate synthase [Streptomyces sp. H27-G5]MCY0959235.1 3-deoxy-7-phosphoheptulonate synthase [Streptomyces sp. H27-H5]